MILGWALIINSVLLGVGLAMDAFSVSLANGLNEHGMGIGRMFGIAGTFAGFQFAMPLIGWLCIHSIAEKFQSFQRFIPWIALALLVFIGGKMLAEGIQENRKLRAQHSSAAQSTPGSDATLIANEGGSGASFAKRVSFTELIVQGIATSIDALSVGFTIADYNAGNALIASLIIGIVTYIICIAGLKLGTTFGTRLAGRAGILGGIILICIGLEIWLTGVIL